MKFTKFAAALIVAGSLYSCGNNATDNGANNADSTAAETATSKCDGNCAKKLIENNAKDTAIVKNLVEVIVFHGVKQCETCQAIKKNTKEVIDEQFADQVKAGKLTYRIVDFSLDENKALAEKYQIAWTSLVIISHDEMGNESVNNISKYAIGNARTNTPEFRTKFAAMVKTALDNL